MTVVSELNWNSEKRRTCKILTVKTKKIVNYDSDSILFTVYQNT